MINTTTFLRFFPKTMEGERLKRLRIASLNNWKSKTWLFVNTETENNRKEDLRTSKIVSTSILVSTEWILIESQHFKLENFSLASGIPHPIRICSLERILRKASSLLNRLSRKSIPGCKPTKRRTQKVLSNFRKSLLFC